VPAIAIRGLPIASVALAAVGIDARADRQLIAREYRGRYGLEAGTAGLRLPVPKSIVIPPNADRADGSPYREVRIDVTVEKTGVVRTPGVVSSVDRSRGGLDDQAIAAVRQWTFEPAEYRGKPEAVHVICVVGFGDRHSQRPKEPGTAAAKEAAEAFAPGVPLAFSTDGLTPPAARIAYNPPFPIEALTYKARGAVEIQVLVEPDGRVGRARVARPLNPASGIDALAMEVARAWIFDPARRNGIAVPSLVSLEFSFSSR
jgi:TonB family protein